MCSREGYFDVYVSFYFLHDIRINQWRWKTGILIHCLCFLLPLFMFCWWRHNRLLMMSQLHDNCDATTWQVISNSLDIDFMHVDIHGRSCKKLPLSQWSDDTMKITMIIKSCKKSSIKCDGNWNVEDIKYCSLWYCSLVLDVQYFIIKILISIIRDNLYFISVSHGVMGFIHLINKRKIYTLSNIS